MSQPDTDSTLTNTNARLTYDKGLDYEKLATEQILYLYDKGRIAGFACDRFNLLSDYVLDLDKPETKAHYTKELERQYQVLYSGLIGLPSTSTTCLLKAATSFQQLLILHLSDPQEYKTIQIAETLLEIFGEVEKRTKKPYQYRMVFDEKDRFKPLPQKILAEFPLSQHAMWKHISQRKRPAAARSKNPVKGQGLIPIVEKEDRPVDEKAMDNAIEAALSNIKIKKELASIPPGDSPLVTNYLENLKRLNLEDVYKQTGVSIRNRADFKLSEMVSYIYYASFITLVLDKNGDPVDGNGVHGLFRYGMILYSRKHKTVKFIPPQGKYVSLGPLPGQQFSIDGGIIKKMSIDYQGILAYQEVDVTGQWEPDYQKEANERFSKNGEYIGSLVVSSAYSPKDIGVSDMVFALPEIVEATMPYFFIVIRKKIKSWFENYEDLLKEIAKEVLKNLIVETLKDLAVRYVVKKIGKKVIPVVNVVAGIKDVVDTIRGIDTERDTIAINCVRLYMKGIEQDDQTLSVKILANIMGDEFENEIKGAIIKHATKQGLKIVNKVKGSVSKPDPAPKPVEQPKALPEPEPTPAPAVTAKPTDQKAGSTDSNVISSGWKAFHETHNDQQKARGTDKKTNLEDRSTDKKENIRPDEVKTPKEEPKKTPPSKEEENKPEEQKTIPTSEEKNSQTDRMLVNRTEGDPHREETHKERDDQKSQKKEAGKKSDKGREKEDKRDKKKQGKGGKEKEEEKESGKSSNTPVVFYPALEVFTHTTQRKFREGLVTIFKNNPNHPLIAIYNNTTKRLQPSTKKGMDTFYWEEHPEAIQAGHVTSKKTGARDQVVIMTASENQKYNNTIETKGASIGGGFKVAIIEGLPISVTSAEHLISYGKLKQEDLDNATIVNVNDL